MCAGGAGKSLRCSNIGGEFIKEIPNQLECAYCIRNYTHGGECGKPKFDERGCIVFKLDPRGCIRTGDFRMQIPIYFKFPPLGTWCDYWTLHGVETEIKVLKIRAIDWNKEKGCLVVHCTCDYYVNEYHDDYIEPNKKPVLKLIQ